MDVHPDDGGQWERSPYPYFGPITSCASTTMATLSRAPVFKPFTLALIQLGNIGADKTANLKHARDMVLKATSGQHKKPDLVVLPVRLRAKYLG